MDRNALTVDRARTVERFGSARWTETPSRSTAREPWSGLGPPDGPKRPHGRRARTVKRFGSARWTETPSRSPRANRGAVWVRQMDRNALTVARARTVERFGSARWTETPSRSTVERFGSARWTETPSRSPRANRGAVWVRQMDRNALTVAAREPWSGLGPPDGPKRPHRRPRANRGAVWVRQMDRNALTVDRGAVWVRQMNRNALTGPRRLLEDLHPLALTRGDARQSQRRVTLPQRPASTWRFTVRRSSPTRAATPS